jgi:hypothetical protein
MGFVSCEHVSRLTVGGPDPAIRRLDRRRQDRSCQAWPNGGVQHLGVQGHTGHHPKGNDPERLFMNAEAEVAAVLQAQKSGGQNHCRQVNRVDPHPLARHLGVAEEHPPRGPNHLIGGQIQQTPNRWDGLGSWIHDVLGVQSTAGRSLDTRPVVALLTHTSLNSPPKALWMNPPRRKRRRRSQCRRPDHCGTSGRRPPRQSGLPACTHRWNSSTWSAGQGP